MTIVVLFVLYFMSFVLFAVVFVGKWRIEILQVVRLHVVVPFGTTCRNYHLSWNAVYQCLD